MKTLRYPFLFLLAWVLLLWATPGTAQQKATTARDTPLELYPNPVAQELYLHAVRPLAGSQYQILSVAGTTLASGTLPPGALSVANLPAGLYTLVIVTKESQTIKRRFLKEAASTQPAGSVPAAGVFASDFAFPPNRADGQAPRPATAPATVATRTKDTQDQARVPKERNLLLPPGRPDPPYNELLTYSADLRNYGPNYPVNLSRHHTITYPVLRDFWNALVEWGDLGLAKDFFVTLSTSLMHYEMKEEGGGGITQADRKAIQGLLKDIRTGNVRHNATAPRPKAMDNLAAIYVWMPNNLFIGPKGGGGRYQRVDDPKSGFEENAQGAVGKYNHEAMKKAYDYMNQYTRSRGEAYASLALDELRKIARPSKVHSLKREAWQTIVGTSQYPRYRLKVKGTGTLPSLPTVPSR